MMLTLHDLVIKYGSQRKAARILGIKQTTFNYQYRKNKQAPVKSTGFFTPKYTKVTVIPDTHCVPNDDWKRFENIGKHIADTNPDHVVHIGDLASLDSLCGHIGNDTYEGKSKPALEEDLIAMHKAIKLITKFGGERKYHITLGNHENRLWIYENMNPEMYGLSNQFMNIFKTCGWDALKFGERLNIDGVDFVHAVLNGSRKPTGGMNPSWTVASKSNRDTVFGHSHKASVASSVKFGDNEDIRAFNVGCAMPWGHIEDYAKHGMTGWWWGIVDLIIKDKKICGWNFIPMFILEEKYA